MAKQRKTVSEFIQFGKIGNATTETIVSFDGFYETGDGGGGDWKWTGVTGQTPSQTPAELGDAAIIDSNGDKWVIADLNKNTLNQLGIVSDSQSASIDNALVIQAALNGADATGVDQLITCLPGVYYYTPEPSIYFLKGHTLSGLGEGSLPNVTTYENDLSSDATTFVLFGTGTKLVRTRREYRGGAGDHQDAPISVGMDLESPGATIENCRLEVYCDYSDDSPTNYGADWDVQVMMSRVDQHMSNFTCKGYPRYKHVLLNATRGVGLPEFNPSFPTDTDAKGIDGCTLTNFKTLGGPGIGILGPKPKSGLLHQGFAYKSGCSVRFAAQPAIGDTVDFDGDVFTFASVSTERAEVVIGATLESTIINLAGAWAIGKQLPYEDLTLDVSTSEIDVYSLTASQTPITATGANISVTEIGSATAVAGTVPISDPAPYYDEILGAAVDDGRNSLGASDIIIDDYVITVAHHSGYRATDIRPDKNINLEPDTIWASLHIDGIGGSIFIHKWFIGAGRFESVEPFNVRLGLCGRGFIGAGVTFDSNITAWVSTTGAPLTSSDQYGKVSGDDSNTCRVDIGTHDDPGDYYPWDKNGNRQRTNFRTRSGRVYSEGETQIGGQLLVGVDSEGSDTGLVRVKSGNNANCEMIFGNNENSNLSRLRTASNGGVTLSLSPSGVGPLQNAMFVSGSITSLYTTLILDQDGAAYRTRSPDGTLYELKAPNGGGAAIWTAV